MQERDTNLFFLFVDLLKAFPSVPRRKLFQKLAEMGLPVIYLLAILSLHANNTFCIRNGGRLSSIRLANRGVREGGILSPLLFSLYFSGVMTVFSQL